ncbi:hypothetical protein BVX97_00990 [bacterium E08(2017)]|nr:hypothetical protein BVX97_00990 [bacterium E08(2017)]
MPTDSSVNVIGVIPARGGSKGVLRKNLRTVGGKPLIAWSIEAAAQSGKLSSFLVSTDDAEIAATAESLGSKVLMREAELADDDTPMVPVVQNIIERLEQEHDSTIDIIVLLQPTAPMRSGDDIDAAVDMFFESKAESLISVTRVEDNHPSRMYRLEEGRLDAYAQEPKARLRQANDELYHRNGALYICTRQLVMEGNTLIGANPVPYIMPRERSVNIDDELDLTIADFLMTEK